MLLWHTLKDVLRKGVFAMENFDLLLEETESSQYLLELCNNSAQDLMNILDLSDSITKLISLES